MDSSLKNISKLLIANRGEIAVRCINAARSLGVASVAIYTISDATSLHVKLADEAVLLAGDGKSGYSNIDDILRVCAECSADAVIPGYGFLSENATFAQKVRDAGLVFVGPTPQSITEMGLKHRAREIARTAKVPIIPGTGLLSSEGEALNAADRLSYPVMLKATGGGGGMGLHICRSPDEIRRAFQMAQDSGKKLLNNADVFLEKYYPRSHHIEVQIFGNGSEIIHFGERECSIQRRHQKVIEECPSPFVEAHPGLRQKLTTCALRYASTLKYKSAGTVEFLVDDDTADFFFLEMNTRLQVEHGITELCYGVDIVALMLRQADLEKGGLCGLTSDELWALQKSGPSGSAIEARIYAEDPYRDFAPSPGFFQEVRWPSIEDTRVDTWIQSGQNVSSHYDPLLAKVMVHAPTRQQAVDKMSRVCSSAVVLRGPITNLDFVGAIIRSNAFAQGRTLTTFLDTDFSYVPCGIDVISGGTYSTIQDFPARPSIGYGVPKSGPMDSISSRIANLLVGNPVGTEVLEITLIGPEVVFTCSAIVAVCGADCSISLGEETRRLWSSFFVQAGQTLKIGSATSNGCRMYLAVRGGFPNIPSVFGSKSTTPSLRYGGLQGRTLRTGDFLYLQSPDVTNVSPEEGFSLPPHMIPNMRNQEVYALQGPHDSEDIMTEDDRVKLYNTAWKVGHNSSRTGIRLLGPKLDWARRGGGEAGSHPSNYLDYGYPSPGGMNWGGDSSCIFTADSPNFGGLICSSTVISADLWKLGQLKPGDTFRLTPVSLKDAVNQIGLVDEYLSAIEHVIKGKQLTAGKFPDKIARTDIGPRSSVLKSVVPSDQPALRPRVTYRQGGDKFLLIEMGEQSANVSIIARLKVLMEKLQSQIKAKLLFTPHISSLMIEYDPLEISQADLLNQIDAIEAQITDTLEMIIPCREIRLPLVMDHPDIEMCIQRYIETVRSKAVYLPDNLEYIRRCNGLSSRREVFDMILQAEYMVPAVGFLCGTPMFYPLSPKVMTCQKYNPTRTNTPGGTIGFGGSLLAGYSIEQPGGYMMAARSLEMWDVFGTKPGFTPERPWLLNPFDKIKFYEVSIEEYDLLARDYFAGRHDWQITESTFDVRKTYESFLEAQNDPDVVDFKRRQSQALEEQEKIEAVLYSEWTAANAAAEKVANLVIEEGSNVPISSPMAANVWKMEVQVGDTILPGQVVAVLEAMKMEINVIAPKEARGQVHAILKGAGSVVDAGDILVLIKESA
ncbi:urea carboxylase [Xylaria bambusicola]|uniref:urea carboxylase n=1 Tax=Xylaria bambusicola TaxID=326684 RepID=UPI00200839FE|nr:urea carboxylase [Xylaria bambusicola]KAI0517925.1 urea carboxylase [Xylaria bambusicola]